MKREFKLRDRLATLSYLEAEVSPGLYGPGPTIKQLVMTFENGRGYVLPFELVDALFEPTSEEAGLFLDGMRERFAPPKPEVESVQGMRMRPSDDGGFDVIPTFHKPKL